MLYRIVFVILFCLLFFYGCYKNTGTDKKNMLGFRSYPEEVKKAVRNNASLSKLAPKEDPYISAILIGNIISFTIIFSLIGVIAKNAMGFKDFKDCFIYFLIFGEVLNLFDLVVIDLLWWRNSKRIRFSCLPNKEPYQNPKTHVDSFLRGIPTFVVVALLTAFIVNLFM